MWSQRDPSARRSAVGNIFIKVRAQHSTLFALFALFCCLSSGYGGSGAGWPAAGPAAGRAAVQPGERADGTGGGSDAVVRRGCRGHRVAAAAGSGGACAHTEQGAAEEATRMDRRRGKGRCFGAGGPAAVSL